MKYYAKCEREPTKDDLRSTELKEFEFSEAEPNTPYFKAIKLFGKSKVIEVLSEEDL